MNSLSSVSSLHGLLTQLDTQTRHSFTVNSVSVSSSPSSSSLSSTSSSTQSSTTVSLSEEALYADLLAQIQASKVTSSGDANQQSFDSIYSDYISDLNPDTDYSTLTWLSDTPTSDSESRQALAQQAADYITNGQYSGTDETVSNPFDGLSRETLSNIAYNTSGNFTTAERLAAGKAMMSLDSRYDSQVYQETKYEADGSDKKKGIELKAELVTISGMSEAEKSAKGIDDNYIESKQEQLNDLETENAKSYSEVKYNNLSSGSENDLMMAMLDNEGNYRWETISSQAVFDNLAYFYPDISNMVSLTGKNE